MIAPISNKTPLGHSSRVTQEEKNQLQVIILTLADPKGNWNYAWKRLCEFAGTDPAKYRPPFKPHPFPESQTDLPPQPPA